MSHKKQSISKEIALTDKTIINILFNFLKEEKDVNIIKLLKNKSYYSYFLKHKFSSNE